MQDHIPGHVEDSMHDHKTAALALVTALSAFALACQPDSSSVRQSGAQVRDSADIRIIENPRRPEGSRLEWRIGPEPTLSIGKSEGEEPYLLHLVRGVARLADGRIVVANRGSSELRMFDARGEHLTSWGGEGDGPGELYSLTGVAAWPGDSVVVWYTSGIGISVFDSEGNYGRSFSLRRADEPSWEMPVPRAVRRDGTILTIRQPENADTAVVEIWDGEGALHQSLGTHPSYEIVATEPEIVTRAYGRELELGLWGDLVVVSPNNRYELKAFAADGTLERIVRREHSSRAPNQADLEHMVEQTVAAIASGGSPGLPPQLMDNIRSAGLSRPLAENFPTFARVMSDAGGHLWVQEYDLPGEERPAPLWTVFDPAGRVLGFVETPSGLVVREIGENYILGSIRDELGVEYVQVWPLERAGG